MEGTPDQDPETGGSLRYSKKRSGPFISLSSQTSGPPWLIRETSARPGQGTKPLYRPTVVHESKLACSWALSIVFLGSSYTICVHSSLQEWQRRGGAAEIIWPPERTRCTIEPFPGRVGRPVHWTSRAHRYPSTEKQCSTPASPETHSQLSGGRWPFPQASSLCWDSGDRESETLPSGEWLCPSRGQEWGFDRELALLENP